MNGLDPKILYKALRSRDKRFDGRFYVGVRTTGIYCRPVCPARPLQKNVSFYRSQAEAEGAGFRPCLRCRPDLSPSSPQWHGTAAVVSRALRMISEGAADGVSIEKFAESLGVSGRHLRRLFDEHVGAAPVDVAASKRLHLARLLLSQTSLPVTRIAFASGFQSIRRFNHAFQARYGRSPRAFRGLDGAAGDEHVFEIPVLLPYDWDSILGFLRAHHALGVEGFAEGRYERLVPGTSVGKVSVEMNAAGNALLVKLHNVEAARIRSVLAQVRHLFDLDHNPACATAPCGPRSLGGIRVPGAFSGFETAVCIILGQMVSVPVARGKIQKLVDLFGEKVSSPYPGLDRLFPTPARLATADFSAVGVTRVRAEAIRELSRLVASNELCLERTASLESTRERLASIKGVGPWTVEMIAMRCLADPDAFPKGDLIIKRVLSVMNFAHEPWSPWRAYLCLWIWKNSARLLKKGSK